MLSIVPRLLNLAFLRTLVLAVCASGTLVACNEALDSAGSTISGGNGGNGSINGNGTSSSSGGAQTSYTIGGTVMGLSGAGLMLANEAGDRLAITGNGGFTFSNQAASGAAYKVTIVSQPITPSQVCTVMDGAGTVGTVNVASVVVNCTTNFYTVGGSVTGLVGTGLVLQTNGTNNVPVATSGNYIFSTLASGTNYTVTVMTQPTNPAQTCTVANDTGQVSTANITNVTITCTVNSYAVSGTVSGLTGAGLVLQTNGANPAPIPGNGTYTLATLPSGTAYAVTVLTQPANPAQLCRVTGGTGTVATADITTVAVHCSTTGRFLFVANPFDNNGNGSLAAFVIAPGTGGLTPAAGSPYTPAPAELSPWAVALDPSGLYLYVANSGSAVVSTYGVNPDGSLAPLFNASTGAMNNNSYSLAVDPAGPYLYVGVDDNVDMNAPPGVVEAFAINAGVLTPVTGALGSSSYPAGNDPYALALDPVNPLLYGAMVYDSTIFGYAVGVGGQLAAVANSPFAFGGGNPVSQPWGVAIHPTGGLMYVTDQLMNTVTAYRYAANGNLVQAGGPYAVGLGPEGVTIDPTGSFLYVSNSGDGTVSGFTINPDTTLTAIAGSPFVSTMANIPSTGTPTTVQVDPSGQFAYVANGDDGTVTVFRINLASGALTQVGAKVSTITLGGGGGPSSIAIE
jgi:6-phosphogluconolactonase (cycloisomerase 2 family)